MVRTQFPKAERCFWEVKAAARPEGSPTATDIYIYDVIGDDWYDPSLTAKELVQKIVAIDTDEIVLHFNSPGGSVSDGIAIYNALTSHPAKVTSLIEGWTGSIATVVALAGETVAMYDNVMFMIHNPWGIQVGNARDMRDYADYLDRVGALMSKVYEARSTKSTAELAAALDAETYLNAEQALEWGFVDVVLSGQAAAASCAPETLEALGFHDLFGAGRVLSAANEAKLRDAVDLVNEVLDSLDAGAQDRSPAGTGDARATMDPQDKRKLASVLTAAKRH